MNLLCFAHRAEAEAFFVKNNYEPDDRLNNFYKDESNKTFLLITGEGPFNSLMRVSSALCLEKKIKKIINLGVSGALNSALKKLEAFSIRTSYFCESYDASPQFKSFPLHSISGLPEIDCITSTQRVKELKQKEHLSNFSDVIDRELWGIGLAAKEHKVKLYSIKVISDEKKDIDFCQDVKDSSYNLSLSLFNSYKLLKKEKPIQEKKTFENDIITDPRLHFTTSQKRSLNKLLKDIKINETELKEIFANSHFVENKKANAKNLLESLSEISTPEYSRLKKTATKLTMSLEKSGINVHYDTSFEKTSLRLVTEVKSKKDIDSKTLAIKNFSFSKWEDFINGDF
jgi:nucleoside phosphorylase